MKKTYYYAIHFNDKINLDEGLEIAYRFRGGTEKALCDYIAEKFKDDPLYSVEIEEKEWTYETVVHIN